MITDRNRGIQRLLLFCQCVMAMAAFWGWFLLCDWLPRNRSLTARYAVYNLFMLAGLLIVSWRDPLISGLRAPGFDEASRRSFRQVAGTLFLVLVYLVLARDEGISRLFLISFMPLLLVLLFATNRALPVLLGRLSFHSKLRQKVLLIGPRLKAIEVKRWLDEGKHLGFDVQGLLTEEETDAADASLPKLGRPEDLQRLLDTPGLMHVVLVELPQNFGAVRDLTDLCEAHGARLLVAADLGRIFGHSVAVFEDQGLFFLGLRDEPLEDPVNRLLKRGLDIAVSLPVVLLLLPPLMLVTWIVHRVQSPGPLFFVQLREGFQNRPFPILKLRSIHVARSDPQTLPRSRSDPRLFPFGSFLRKTSLDEVPQFWNVLRGEMSVVGPRPHMAAYNLQYHRVYFRVYVRTFVKPGITGLAQARGFRGNAETPEEIIHRMESDIEYLENWSFALDCWLILRTALQVVCPPKNAV